MKGMEKDMLIHISIIMDMDMDMGLMQFCLLDYTKSSS